MGSETRRTRKPSRRNKTKKRRQSAQNTTLSTSESVDLSSSSAKKLKPQTTEENSNTHEGNIVINAQILTRLFQKVNCIECGNPDTKVNITPIYGLASRLVISCPECEYILSEDLNNKVAGNEHVYDINRRYVLAITNIGGHSSNAEALAAYMDLPNPVTTYQNHLKVISESAQKVASTSASQAAKEAQVHYKSNDITVSVDGTWQKRGFSSKNGILTVATSLGKNEANKIIDTEIMTTYCSVCANRNRDDVRLSTIKSHHDCQINHEGSAGKMESEGAVRCFKRSEEKFSVRYTKYLGDGDSKAFTTVDGESVYGEDVKLEKLECTGHVQKRMGKALITAVAANKGEKFIVNSKGKLISGMTAKVANRSRGEKMYIGIGGPQRLTKRQILKIQGHYGTAIRENESVERMQTAIWDIYNHRAGKHNQCPQWCASHQRDLEKANKNRLPDYICDIIKPIFERLSSRELLEKCTHGGTQNANEAFHHLIWNLCPKEKFCGAQRLSVATSIATILYNDGQVGLLDVYSDLGLTVGSNLRRFVNLRDQNRVKSSLVSCSDSTKKSRKKSRQSRDTEHYDGGAFP